MSTVLWVAFGSALGGVARYGTGILAARIAGEGFPWGTLAVNVAGSLVIGLFVAATTPGGRFAAGEEIRAFVAVGLCGGFTTFSAFSMQTFALIQQGDWPRAGLNVAASIVLCLLAVWLGHAAGSVLAVRA